MSPKNGEGWVESSKALRHGHISQEHELLDHPVSVYVLVLSHVRRVLALVVELEFELR